MDLDFHARACKTVNCLIPDYLRELAGNEKIGCRPPQKIDVLPSMSKQYSLTLEGKVKWDRTD